MKKFNVIWKPRVGGRVQFRTEIKTAVNAADALRQANLPKTAELVEVREEVVDLWTPLVQSGAAAALMNHLRDADDAYLARMHAEGRPVRD